MSGFGGLQKHQNNPAIAESVKAFKMWKFGIGVKKRKKIRHDIPCG